MSSCELTPLHKRYIIYFSFFLARQVKVSTITDDDDDNNKKKKKNISISFYIGIKRC